MSCRGQVPWPGRAVRRLQENTHVGVRRVCNLQEKIVGGMERIAEDPSRAAHERIEQSHAGWSRRTTSRSAVIVDVPPPGESLEAHDAALCGALAGSWKRPRRRYTEGIGDTVLHTIRDSQPSSAITLELRSVGKNLERCGRACLRIADGWKVIVSSPRFDHAARLGRCR